MTMSENVNITEEPFLQVKDLTVEYTSDVQVVHAVNGVSLSLNRGQTLGLVGETGAGKTTIAKSILRILPDVLPGSHDRFKSGSAGRRTDRRGGGSPQPRNQSRL